MISNPSNSTSANTAPPITGSGRKLVPLRSWRNHADLGVSIFLAVLILGVPVALKTSKPKFSSEAVVVIWPKFLKNLQDDSEFDLQSNTQYREFVQQNVRTVDRYDIIEEAIKRLDSTPHPWRHKGESVPSAVGRLRSALTVSPVPETYQIALQLEARTSDGLPETLNTVVSVFLEKSKEEEFYGRDQSIDSLKAESLRLEEQIDTLGKEKSSLGEDLGVTVFGDGLINPYDRLLVESKEALASARQRRIVAVADLEAMQGHTGSENDSAVGGAAFDMAQKNPALMTLQANLNLRRTELMAKLSDMLPTHPGRPAMEKEIAEIDSMLKNKNDALSQTYSNMLLAQRRAEATSAAQVERQTQSEVDSQGVEAAQYSDKYQKGLYLSLEMERARKRLEAIDERQNFLSLESGAPGFAHIFSPARDPATPVGNGPKRMIMLFAAAGLAFGLIVPVVMDMFNPFILSPAEAEAKLGFRALGFTYLSIERTESVQQVRRLAAAIDREGSRNGSRTYLFVPANDEPDVPGLLHRIADELRVLDHSVCVLGCEQTQTLADPVLAGSESHATDSFHDAAIPRFGSLRWALSRVTSPDQFVLLTSGSFSDDADAELLATSSDVVVLTVQAAHTTREELVSCAKTIERIQPKAVSLVVTDYDPDPPPPPSRVARFVSYLQHRVRAR